MTSGSRLIWSFKNLSRQKDTWDLGVLCMCNLGNLTQHSHVWGEPMTWSKHEAHSVVRFIWRIRFPKPSSYALGFYSEGARLSSFAYMFVWAVRGVSDSLFLCCCAKSLWATAPCCWNQIIFSYMATRSECPGPVALPCIASCTYQGAREGATSPLGHRTRSCFAHFCLFFLREQFGEMLSCVCVWWDIAVRGKDFWHLEQDWQTEYWTWKTGSDADRLSRRPSNPSCSADN